jgi:sigma-B regulation protein RsbU (phosphoserine phosphatase)
LLAADIQRGLLPSIPPDGSGLHWAARLVQAGRIGGDLYDFVRLADGSWLVLVGDVSGKGVPAALILASIRTMFRMSITETSDPGALVQRMSQRLYEDHGGNPYVTCVVVRMNVRTRELAYVNAGHPPGIVVDPSDDRGAPLLLASSGPPAGLFSNQVYQTLSVTAAPGAVSILVSDGITEALDVLGLTEPDPVEALLAQAPRPLKPDRLCDALIERTTPALAKGDWQDDRTVVAFSFDLAPHNIAVDS